MFHTTPQPLLHLPGTAPSSEVQLPRGECGFIQPESPTNAQRCQCRGFYPDSTLRSRCGCGHQAWHHEIQPLSTVSVNEYIQVVEQMKQLKHQVRRYENLEQELKQEILKERMAREEHFRMYKALEARLYDNMRLLKISMDDRVEAVVDRTTECSDQIRAVQERLTMVDEATMELENRIDRVERPALYSRDATPQPRTSTPKATPVSQLPLLMQPQHLLPIRTDKKYPSSWSVRVIFVPRRSQRFAFDPDSSGYRRCASRKLQQNLEFPSADSSCFSGHIETVFRAVLRGRSWMPMTGHRPVDEPFGRMALTLLPPDLTHRDLWDYPFLEDHCIAHDKMQGDVLYIALQHEDVTWNDIRFLPPVHGIDESCWSHDEELDGAATYKSLDTEIMYDCQDPPPTYSSRTHSVADRAPSKLDVLADSAAMMGPMERARIQSQTQSSRSSLVSPRHIQTPSQSSRSSVASLERSQTQSSHSSGRFSSERNSLRSFETEHTDDEHRDKKPKLRSKQSMAGVAGHNPQPIYVSGRSKRKMPVREKGAKEPLHFSVTNVARWRPNLLHPHSSKGKEIAPSQ
jgi:hypothetical protein